MKTLVFCAMSFAIVSLTASAAQPLGIDVSSFQGHPNWTSVKGDGVLFAYAKATTGTTQLDVDYNYNMNNGKAAGVLMGAVHYARPDLNTAAQEANYFWNNAGQHIKADNKTLFPVIDVETFGGHVGSPSYTAWVNSWSADVKAKTNAFMHPVLYASPCTGMCDFTTACTLQQWVPNPGASTAWTTCLTCNYADPGGTKGWTFWLFNNTGSITGISGNVDFDTYNGTFAQLKTNEVVGIIAP